MRHDILTNGNKIVQGTIAQDRVIYFNVSIQMWFRRDEV